MLYSARDFAGAAAQFETANRICGAPHVTLVPLAKAQLLSQQLEPSLGTISEFLRLQPRDTDALKLKGDVLYLLGREQEAEESLLQVLSIKPDYEDAEYALARIRYQQNRFPEAVERFKRLVDRDPGNYKAHDNLALCYAALQQDALALQHFLKALELVSKAHPEYDTVYANASNFFFERGEFEKAFQMGAEAARRNPNYARNFFLTGKALVRLDKHELSLRWFNQAAELDPTYKEAYYWLGTVYRKLGKTEEATRSLARFQELSKAPAVKR
jgi:superkiller protein 3